MAPRQRTLFTGLMSDLIILAVDFSSKLEDVAF